MFMSMRVAYDNRMVGSIMVNGGIVMVMELMLKISLKSSMVLHIILMMLVIWLLDGNLLNRIGITSMHLVAW